MRAEIARAERNLVTTRDSLRFNQDPQTESLIAMVMAMLETLPQSFAEYRRLTSALDRATRRINSGDPVLDAWADLEIEMTPILQNIRQQEAERARLTGQRNRTM
jgi:hypothetical protein